MNVLPSSEVQANDYLNGFNLHGNWPPQALTVIAYACMRHGIDESGYEALVAGSAIHEELIARGEQWGLLAKQWAYAETTFESYAGTGGIRERAEALYYRVLTADFGGGQKAITAKMVALAAVTLAWQRGAYTFNWSVRFGSYRSGVADIKNVSEANSLLLKLGLFTDLGRTPYGRRIKLNLGWRGSESTTNKIFREYFFVVETDPPVRKGIGPVAGLILELDRAHEDTIPTKRLPDMLKVSLSAVKRARALLNEHGLDADSSAADFKAVAGHLGVDGYHQRLAERYAHDQVMNAEERGLWVAEQTLERAAEEMKVAARFDRIHQEISEETSRKMEELSHITPFHADPFEGSAS